MDARELRIGNYILDDGGIVSKINGFKPFDHYVRCDELEGCVILIDVFNHKEWSKGWETKSVNIKPIKLTEGILLECGFEKEILEPKHFCIKGMCIWKCNDMFLCDKNGVHIKYLHQLQNLYFALTNEELNVKL